MNNSIISASHEGDSLHALRGEVKRFNHLDVLRLLATFSVILVHVVSKKIKKVDHKELLMVYDGMVRWAVPMFVLISGTIFLNKSYPASVGRMLKKAGRLFVAMLFWNAFYILYLVLAGAKAKRITEYAVTGYFHFWFIWMIMGLYLITPLLRCIIRDKKMENWFLLLSLLFASIIPTLKNAIIPYTALRNNTIILKLFENYDNMNLQFVMGYSGLFMLGHWLSEKELKKSDTILYSLLAIIGFAVNICGNRFLTLQEGALIQVFNDPIGIFAIMQSVGLYAIFKYVFDNKVKNPPKILRRLSSYCFGAYLVHLLYRNLLYDNLKISAVTYDYVLWPPLLALIIFIMSMATSAIFHLIPVLKKYVV